MALTKAEMADGGHTQSQKVYYCQLCDQFGRGNHYKEHHIDTGKCEGKGVKNWYARKFNRMISNLF